ncbi:MAG: hypothetical protein ACN4GW_07690 [Desulforhopalus sp.]
MDTTQMAKQTLEFQKTTYNNSFNAMVLAQEQTEKMLSSYIEKLPWTTEENIKSLDASVEMGKKARDDFKKAVDEGYAKFEEMLVKK